MAELTWDRVEEIALALLERYPDQDPLKVRYTDLHRWVTELDGFRGDPKASTEGKLEAIQMAWYEEWKDSQYVEAGNGVPASELFGACRVSRRAPREAHEQRHQKNDQEQEEQELRNSCRRRGNPREPENRGDDRNYEKHERPTQHGVPPLVTLAFPAPASAGARLAVVWSTHRANY